MDNFIIICFLCAGIFVFSCNDDFIFWLGVDLNG